MTILKADWTWLNEGNLESLLSSYWINLDKWIITESNEVSKYRIENILWKSPLSELLIFLNNYWIIELSDSISNIFPREKETKILDVEPKEIITNLKDNFWADIIFDWEIRDNYFDTEDKDFKKWIYNSWKKSSFRIRYKKWKWDESWKYYCTIKRKSSIKNTNSIIRDVYEEEFIIPDIELFKEAIIQIWLIRSRSKFKDRISLVLNENIQFDIDDFTLFPPLLEIEALTEQIVQTYINVLWLEKHETLNWWSTTLFKHYNETMKTF